MRIRPATAADAMVIAEIVIEGDSTFAGFAPAGWQPPAYETELQHAREAIASPDRWTAVAILDDQPVAYAAFVAATLTRKPSNEPGLAHLGRLFVRQAQWGTGVAVALHAEAIDAATAKGFEQMRLFTPTAHARACRFYEREGWLPVAEMAQSELGLPLTEYRRALGSRRR